MKISKLKSDCIASLYWREDPYFLQFVLFSSPQSVAQCPRKCMPEHTTSMRCYREKRKEGSMLITDIFDSMDESQNATMSERAE